MIQSIQEADARLLAIGRAKAKVKAAEADRDVRVQLAEKACQRECAKPLETIAAAEAELEAFLREHPPKPPRRGYTRRLGSFGWKKRPPKLERLKTKSSWDKLVEPIARVLGETFVKRKPTIDREAIRAAAIDGTIDAAKLRQAGCKLILGSDVLVVKTREDADSAKDTPEAAA